MLTSIFYINGFPTDNQQVKNIKNYDTSIPFNDFMILSTI